jgi:hypothetical protein
MDHESRAANVTTISRPPRKCHNDHARSAAILTTITRRLVIVWRVSRDGRAGEVETRRD